MSGPIHDPTQSAASHIGSMPGSRVSYQVPAPFVGGTAPHHLPAGPSPSLGGRGGTAMGGFDALSLLKALRRRWALALLVGVILAGLVGGIAWTVVPSAKYTASAVLRVMQHTPVVIFEGRQKEPDFKVFQKTQIAFLQSDKVLKAALRDPKVAQLPTVREHAESDQVEWLKEQLKILFNDNSEVLQLSLSGDRPADLEVLVNAVVDAYMQNVVEEDRRARLDRLEKLRKLWETKQVELKGRRQSLKALGEAAGSTDRETLAFMQQEAYYNIQQAKVRRLQYMEDIRRYKMELEAAKVVLKPTSASAGDKPAADLSADAIEAMGREIEQNNPSWRQLDQEVRQIQAKLGRLKSSVRNYRSDPAYHAVSNQLAEARDRRDEYKRRHVEARILNGGLVAEGGARVAVDPLRIAQLEAQIKALEQYKTDVDREIASLQEDAKRLNTNTLDVTQEQEEITLASETSRKVGAEVESIEVELSAPERVSVIQRADTPRKKDEMKRLRLIGAAAGGAFMFALFGVSFWEYRARRISSVEEVINSLGMTIVGALPAMPERPRRKLGGPSSKAVEERWQKLLVESVDAMRTMLLHASRVDSLRVIMVTSAGQGEGKTSLAGHLATSLARAGRNTLLVDCDIRRPTIHRLFDEPLDPGFCELLRGDISALDVIRQGPTPDLSIVTAGRHDELAQQLLGQDRVCGVFEEWKQQFEFIVIDTPPVLPVADSLLLAPHVDGALFAILRGVSRVPQVQAAYERLARLGTRMLGAVVNGAQSDPQQYSSHYYIDESSAD